jgi:MinD superfamily P-loop ATPase
MIVSSHEQPLSMHVLLSSMLTTPYLCKLGQYLEVVSSDKDIHSLLGVAKEKVEDFLLNMCSNLKNNSCNNMLKCIVGYCMFTSVGALKQVGTWIVNTMTTLTL